MKNMPRIQKWEELQRNFSRLNRFYITYIIDDHGSFSSVRDAAKNFFRTHYELKEALKKLDFLPENLKGHKGKTEKFVSENPIIALGIDIANKEKHITLNKPRTDHTIGNINTALFVLNPGQHDRSEAKITINGRKEDCLEIAGKIMSLWQTFLTNHNLIKE